jgi:hypothetical protein
LGTVDEGFELGRQVPKVERGRQGDHVGSDEPVVDRLKVVLDRTLTIVPTAVAGKTACDVEPGDYDLFDVRTSALHTGQKSVQQRLGVPLAPGAAGETDSPDHPTLAAHAYSTLTTGTVLQL